MEGLAVACIGVAAMLARRASVVAAWPNVATILSNRLLPRRVSARVAHWLMQ